MSAEPLRPRFRPSRGATAALVLLALGLAAWVTATSQIFQIQAVEVRGNARLSEEEVLRLAGVPPGANLLTLSLGEVERSLARSPWVRSARADRSLPSTLVITVSERAPVARVTNGGEEALVAADGVVLLRRAQAGDDVPSLGAASGSLRIGERVRGFAVPLRVAASMPPRLRSVVEEAGVEAGEVVLVLDGGGRALYGPAEALPAKHAALGSMLAFARKRGIQVDYVDVRVPAAPALKPVGSGG